MKADLVVKNKDDTRRARVYKHESDEGWDFDVFHKHALGGGWTVMAAILTSNGESPARTRKEALSWVEDRIGSFTAINVETVTEGWPEKESPKPTKDAAVEIRRGQIWRQGSRLLIVEWIAPHWNELRCAGEFEVGCHFVTPSGREVGTMIKHRRSARQRYHEQRFREKFRFVCQPEDAGKHKLKIEGL